jgi:hypothetical protein
MEPTAQEITQAERRIAAAARCEIECAAFRARGLVAHGEAETARALRILGIEAHTVIIDADRTGCFTTPEGVATEEALRHARRIVTSTRAGLARRFAKRPEVLAEFRTAFALDASRDVLRDILMQLWRRSRVRKQPQFRPRGPSRAVQDMRKAARKARKVRA